MSPLLHPRSTRWWAIALLLYHAFDCIYSMKSNQENDPVLIPILPSSSSKSPVSSSSASPILSSVFRDDMSVFDMFSTMHRQRRPSDTSLLAQALEQKTTFDSIRTFLHQRRISKAKRLSDAHEADPADPFSHDPVLSGIKKAKITRVKSLPSPPKSLLFKPNAEIIMNEPELIQHKDEEIQDEESIVMEDTDGSDSPQFVTIADDYRCLQRYAQKQNKDEPIFLCPDAQLFEPSENPEDGMSLTGESQHSTPLQELNKMDIPQDSVLLGGGSMDSNKEMEKVKDTRTTQGPSMHSSIIETSTATPPSVQSVDLDHLMSNEDTFDQDESSSISLSYVSLHEDPTSQWIDIDYSTLMGQGSFGWVYRGLSKDAAQVPFAIKILSNKRRPIPLSLDAFHDEATKEASMCRLLNFPTVMKCRGPFFSESGQQAHIVMDYCESDVKAQMVAQQMDVNRSQCMLWQLIHTLSYLHQEKHIAHLDIKPSNILIPKYSRSWIKLGDFGSAHQVGVRGNTSWDRVGGTNPYMAPELFKTYFPLLSLHSRSPYRSLLADTFYKDEFDAFAADVFSAGMTYFVARFGYKPWRSSSPRDRDFVTFVRDPASLFKVQVGKGVRYPHPARPSHANLVKAFRSMSTLEKRLILGLLDINWKTRFTTSFLLQDPYFQSLADTCPTDLVAVIRKMKNLSMDTKFSPLIPSKSAPKSLLL